MKILLSKEEKKNSSYKNLIIKNISNLIDSLIFQFNLNKEFLLISNGNFIIYC